MKKVETSVMLVHLSNFEKDRHYILYIYIYICPNEIKQALEKMKNNKAVGSCNISIEV